MSRLLALCLLIFHAVVPAQNVQTARGDLPPHASWVAPSPALAIHRDRETRGDESVSPDAAHGEAVAWVRDARSLTGVFTTRADAPAGAPAVGAATGRLSIEAAFAASVRVRTLDDSHEVNARGALLPYYPTAPPLRG
ncbi:MAG: hypothetical protein ACJ79A_19205 [Gemmatimonadaceae bacterium]